jgi:hypothetical protein
VLTAVAVTTVFVVLSWGRMSRSIDSSVYLGAAENLAHGHGATTQVTVWWNRADPAEMLRDYGEVGLTDFPPGYPVTMSPLVAAGMDPLQAARVVGIAGFFVSVLLTGLIVRELLGPAHRIAPVLAAVLVAFGPTARVTPLAPMSWASVHASVLSEVVYTPLVLLGALALLWHLRRGSGRDSALWIGAIAMGAACLVRYLGLAAVAGGALFLVMRRGGRRQGIFFLVVGLAPLAAWLIVNRVLYGATGGKPYAWHPHAIVEPIVQTMAGWFTGAVMPSVLAALVLAVVVAVPIASRGTPRRAGVQLLVVLVATHLAVLIATALFFDRVVLLDDRTLVPVRPLVVASVIVVWTDVVARLRSVVTPVAVCALLVAAVISGLAVARDTIRRAHPGVTAPDEVRDELLAVRRQYPDRAMASDNTELLWWTIHVPAVDLPRRPSQDAAGRPNPRFDTQVDAFVRAAEQRCGILVVMLGLGNYSLVGDAASVDDLRARTTTVNEVLVTDSASVYLVGAGLPQCSGAA